MTANLWDGSYHNHGSLTIKGNLSLSDQNQHSELMQEIQALLGNISYSDQTTCSLTLGDTIPDLTNLTALACV